MNRERAGELCLQLTDTRLRKQPLVVCPKVASTPVVCDERF